MAWTETITLMTAEARNRSNTTSDQSVSDAEILGYLNREIEHRTPRTPNEDRNQLEMLAAEANHG